MRVPLIVTEQFQSSLHRSLSAANDPGEDNEPTGSESDKLFIEENRIAILPDRQSHRDSVYGIRCGAFTAV